MDMNLFRGIITVILLVAFIGLWIWAWSSKRRKQFDEAANLPFRDENETTNDHSRGDRK